MTDNDLKRARLRRKSIGRPNRTRRTSPGAASVRAPARAPWRFSADSVPTPPGNQRPATGHDGWLGAIRGHELHGATVTNCPRPGMSFATSRSVMVAAKLEKRRRPHATVGCSALLLFIVGACARAGDGDAIAPFEAGAPPGLDADSDGSNGSRAPASAGESGEPGSGVEAGSTSAADGGLAGDAASGAPRGASMPDANQQSTGGAAAGGGPN